MDSYLGMFELCEHMLQNDQLSAEMFSNQYRYRLVNIHSNAQIMARINTEPDAWSLLIALMARHDLAIPQP